jgi:hypothetical protein
MCAERSFRMRTINIGPSRNAEAIKVPYRWIVYVFSILYSTGNYTPKLHLSLDMTFEAAAICSSVQA